MTKHVLETAQELSQIIEQNLEDHRLKENEVALDVNVEEYESFTDVEYSIETTDLAEEYRSESTSVEDAYPVGGEYPLSIEVMKENLKDNFVDVEVRLNGETINYSPSPDYQHFNESEENGRDMGSA